MAFLDFLGPIGDLVGGLLNLGGTAMSNQTNLQATRETNEQNYKMFQEQLGFTENMWNKNNEYNSPKNQRSLYEAAGFNPYLAMGNMASGEATMASSPSPNPMQVPRVEAPQVGSFIADAGRSYVDSVIKRQQAESLGLDNKAKLISLRYKEANEVLDLYNKRKDIIAKGVKTDADRKQIDFLDTEIREKEINLRYLDGYLNARNDRERSEADKMAEEAKEAEFKAKYQKILTDFLPKIQQSTLNLLANQSYAAYASGVSSMEQGKTIYKLRPLQVLEQTLKNGLAANQFTLSDLGLSDAQLEQARKAGVIEYRNGHPVIKHLDNFVNWFGNSVGSVLRGIFK